MNHAEFIAYVWSFYGPKGLYPIEGITKEQVSLGIKMQEAAGNFDGDSINREAIRDMILVNLNQFGGCSCFQDRNRLPGGLT